MRKSESASRLQKRSVMKAMRVMILAAVALTGCGPGMDGEGATDEYATAEHAITEGCEELNCQEKRTLIAPGTVEVLPQDPVPLHTGRGAPNQAVTTELIKPR